MSYALITGASKGIGRAIAVELARRRWNLLLVARSEGALQSLASELTAQSGVKADYLAIDLSEPDAPRRVVDWCTGKGYSVTALINNAGYGLSGPFERYSPAENANMMQVNMLALAQLCQLLLPQLRQQSRAYIMNIASSAAYQAVPGLSLYAATKAFVLSFSRGLRQELRPGPVSVTCICPGPTDTDFVVRAGAGPKALRAADKVNMTPEAVARIAVDSMLAGKAEVITGALNKVGAFFSWLLPKGLVEQATKGVYE